jgi:pimeloyl-ACP methyl ester carboxylesterase
MEGFGFSERESIETMKRWFALYKEVRGFALAIALRYRVEHGVRKLPNGRFTWKYDRFLRDQRRQRNITPADLWPVVGQITVPTLILRGSESDVFSPEAAKRMHELIPASRLIEIAGAGHSIPADAPEAFERAVREFVGA